MTAPRRFRAAQRAGPRPARARAASPAGGHALPPEQSLQRTLGNQAMRRLLRSQSIQPQLTINQPDDEFEREAEQVADHVMRMPAPDAATVTQQAPLTIQRRCPTCEGELQDQTTPTIARAHIHVNRMCPECEKEKKEDEEETPVQAKRASGSARGPSTGLESYLAASRGGGQPLSPSARSWFEPRFGYDFSHVRIHSDSRAAGAAARIGAQAFTTGADIYFGSRYLQPSTSHGRRLLAHELTHVIQQQGGTRTLRARQSTGPVIQRAPLTALPAGAFDPSNWLIQGPGNVLPTPIVPTVKGQGFWDVIRDALRPRPCKFWICETTKVCKPPDKEEDFLKPWKWKCRDTKVCWCGLHDVPDDKTEGALLALAAASDDWKATILGSSLMQLLWRFVVGDRAWPLALRILARTSSKAVPSLDEATWFLADRAIKSGEHALALGTILENLASRRLINPSLADWAYVARADRDEALTTFTWLEDRATHERRARPPVSVEIYTPAFTSVGWLFSSMMHEYVHVLQVLAGAPASEFGPQGEQSKEFVARDEVEAYLWEIEHAVGSGVINNATQMDELGKRLARKFTQLSDALKAEYRPRYDAAQKRVLEVLSQRPGMSIDEARRIVQESSQEIAELLKQRPGNEEATDRRIAEIRQRRAQALIEVALVDNPNIQVVRPGDPGTYRVPTLDAEGRVRYIHGGIQVAWHMGETSTSAYTIGEAIGAGGKVAISGTAVQGRIHPFPPDIDFDEHIHVVADTVNEAGRLAAERIIASIRRISGGTTPGRTDLEFRHLITFPKRPGKQVRMSLAQVRQPNAVDKLAPGIAQLNGGNLTTYWRGLLADGRLTEVTRVIFVTAERRDGMPLIEMSGSADFNLAFLEDPGALPPTALAKFAWEMCCEAVKRAKRNEWLKAAKRAYNYFSTIGDLGNMARLEPLFQRAEPRVEQFAVVIDAIKQALVTKDPMGPKQEGTRIVTADHAREQVESAARIVESILPDSGARPSPSKIAATLRTLARSLRSRDPQGHLMLDDALAYEFELQAAAIRVHINAGIRDPVKDIVERVVRPVCPDEDKCKKN